MNTTLDTFYSVRHDFVNHSIFLHGLIEEKNNEKALNYLNKVLEKVNLPNIIETGRTDIDCIVNFKILKAKQLNILIESEIAIPYELNVSEYDMVIILGNILDNAMEASKDLPCEERIIKLYMRYDRRRLIIRTKNKNNGVLKVDTVGNLLTIKRGSKQKHGIGIMNIKKQFLNIMVFLHMKLINMVFLKLLLCYT